MVNPATSQQATNQTPNNSGSFIRYGQTTIKKGSPDDSLDLNATTDSGGDSPFTQNIYNHVTVSTSYSVKNNDAIVTCNAGSLTITLPNPTAFRDGRTLVVKEIAGVGSITINPNDSETIDGESSHSLGNPFAAVVLMSNGTNWFIVSSYGGVAGDD